MESEDQFFMEEALAEAKQGFSQKEVPIGAVLVYRGKIISRAHNLVEGRRDPTAHAEILCLKKGAEFFNNWRLLETTLYCTVEPCPMCAGAMIASRLPRLVWGAPDVRQGACGSLFSILGGSHPIHRVSVSSGVLAAECGQILKDFFREVRNGKNV